MEKPIPDVEAEGAVTFPLGFVKELVRRGLMREVEVLGMIIQDIRRFVSGQGGLDIEDLAVRLIRVRILDDGEGGMGFRDVLMARRAAQIFQGSEESPARGV